MSEPRRSPRRPPGGQPPHLASQLGEYAGYGLTMAVSTALFSWLGSLLDARLSTQPVFVLIGAFLGFGGGFYSMYWRLVIKGPGNDAEDG